MNICECGSRKFEKKRDSVVLMGQVGAAKIVNTVADCCSCGATVLLADEEE